MARHLEYTIAFDAPAATVYREYTRREYWEKSMEAFRDHTPLSEVIHFASGDAGTDIGIRHCAPPAILPAILRAVLPINVIISREQRIEPFDHTRNRADGSLLLSVPATPVQLAGTYSLSGTNGGSRLRLDVVCKARIPLIGGKIEEAIVSNFPHFFDFEESFMADWIAGQS